MAIQLLADSGKNIKIAQRGDHTLLDHVPAAIFRFRVTENMAGISYDLDYVSASLPVPPIRYGEHEDMVRAVVDSYDPVDPPYGALAIGRKGSGKTLLFNDICNRMIAHGVPVVLIESGIAVEHLRSMLQVVGKCVLFFDEFGKHYREDRAREALLALFSDDSLVGRIWLATGNNEDEFSEFVLDRPGRFRYLFTMRRMSTRALTDYFERNRIPKERLLWLTSIRAALTFDILTCIHIPLRESTSFREFQRRIQYFNVPKPSEFFIYCTNKGVHLDGTPLPKDHPKISGMMQNDGLTMDIRYQDLEGQFHETTAMMFDEQYQFITDTLGIMTSDGRLAIDVSLHCGRILDSSLLPGQPVARELKHGGTLIESVGERVEDLSITPKHGNANAPIQRDRAIIETFAPCVVVAPSREK